MPTVLRVDGFRLYFYSHEPGEPQHVHVDRGAATAKVWLDDVTLANNSGFSAKELGDVLQLVRMHRQKLVEAWREFFDAGGGG